MDAPDLFKVDLSAIPAAARPWMLPIIASLNKLVQQLRPLSSAGPSYRELTSVTTLSFPIEFPNPLPRQPQDVHIAKVTREGGDPIAVAIVPVWTMASANRISITSLAGLQAGSTYQVRLAIQ